jgi:hypothetical protein
MNSNREAARLQKARGTNAPWKKWGPYVPERQWGTVREDYSQDGTAWDYFTHDQARSRSEGGLAAISDDKQLLCFALALWNGRDPILKRMFGLANRDDNQGEDVKEYYSYLDSTPTHSYMKYLYRYPQNPFPCVDLVQTNRSRNRKDLELGLPETGIFEDNRYLDVFVEYAKSTPEDILIQISICNRWSEAASIHVLPTLWFSNTWNWSQGAPKPVLKQGSDRKGVQIVAAHSDLGTRFLYCEGDVPLLFTGNETNNLAFGKQGTDNPQSKGTKASAHYELTVNAGQTTTIWLRLSDWPPENMDEPFGRKFAETIQTRRSEADEFYKSITPSGINDDPARVMRQAVALKS